MFTKSYIEQLKKLHSDKTRPQGFGGKVKKLGKFFYYMEKWKPNTFLDYGCGKGLILERLQMSYPQTSFTGYDPAVKIYEKNPQGKFDCVFSNDVLEHIEPEFINDVLIHINTLSSKYIWLRIDTLPARKTLPDGRNAHILLQDKQSWLKLLESTLDGEIVYSELDKKGKFDVAVEKINTR